MSNVIVGSIYKTRSYLELKSIKIIDTKIVTPNLIATVEDQENGECFEVTGSELLADYSLKTLPKKYLDVQELNQSECYKQRVIELNKEKPDQVTLMFLENRIAKIDANNNSQEPKVFTGTLENTYLVGGAVRDFLLGFKSHDNDYVVVGSNSKAMLDLGFTLVGESSFPVFLHPDTKDEYALARTERKNGVGYQGFVVDSNESITLEEDLSRRDLTINSMAFNDENKLIDPFNGKADLENKILKHTSCAFAEDPVRVLRIARFLARYGTEWSIHPETYSLMKKLSDDGELKNLTPERVWKETEKALNEKYPDLYFSTLNGFGIFPEIEAMVDVPQPVNHHPEGDVFTHTMLVLRRAADLDFDLATRFASLTHDFGKPISFSINGKLHGHEQDGVPIIESFCQRLKVSNELRTLAILTSDNHTRCHQFLNMKPRKVHKLIVERFKAIVHPDRFVQFLQTCQCDAQGRGETLVNKPYPQREMLNSLLKSLLLLDRKTIVKTAMDNGKKGKDIGLAIRVEEIQLLRVELAKLQN